MRLRYARQTLTVRRANTVAREYVAHHLPETATANVVPFYSTAAMGSAFQIVPNIVDPVPSSAQRERLAATVSAKICSMTVGTAVHASRNAWVGHVRRGPAYDLRGPRSASSQVATLSSSVAHRAKFASLGSAGVPTARLATRVGCARRAACSGNAATATVAALTNAKVVSRVRMESASRITQVAQTRAMYAMPRAAGAGRVTTYPICAVRTFTSVCSNVPAGKAASLDSAAPTDRRSAAATFVVRQGRNAPEASASLRNAIRRAIASGFVPRVGGCGRHHTSGRRDRLRAMSSLLARRALHQRLQRLPDLLDGNIFERHLRLELRALPNLYERKLRFDLPCGADLSERRLCAGLRTVPVATERHLCLELQRLPNLRERDLRLDLSRRTDMRWWPVRL